MRLPWSGQPIGIGTVPQRLRASSRSANGSPAQRSSRTAWLNMGCHGRSDRSRKESKMPKLKTKSGVKKRFTMTASGKVKHGVAGKRHRLISHNAKYIRQNRGTSVLSEADTPTIKLWAPYGLK
jgi:large subunit ribosomal protein L35